ncbi:hypothetical protein scyTo_0011332 [Scyliorhinus torazame]|uniref:Translin-associated factor X-interacting protein 1 N-terminal domain-containing protein n=1 Tax=Scyliorhinus torazame TaxID=75743 RepID=A0A401NL28_SCYTO|nr:hypothetical protein [Scyliorhinus torazame]
MSKTVGDRQKALVPLNQGGTSSKLNVTVPSPTCLTYRLTGKNMKYHLPQKQLLPSVVKNDRYLSSWPGHVGGEIVQQKQTFQQSNYNRYHGFDVTNTNNAPKPRFLEQLETHLRKELQVLDLSGPNAHEVKIQAYREVFEYFIEDLKTYKPLLSAIKNEYEITLVHLRNRIRELEPLKSLLVATSETCERRINALREEERFEIQSLKNERIQLLGKIDNLLRMQDSLETQVRKLKEELAAEYERYREQHDARKLLISDMNNLRYQQEQSTDSHKHEAEAVEDTVKLKLALKVAREDLKALQVELNAMKAEYGDVVPRRDFEALDKNYNELTEKDCRKADDSNATVNRSLEITAMKKRQQGDEDFMDKLVPDLGYQEFEHTLEHPTGTDVTEYDGTSENPEGTDNRQVEFELILSAPRKVRVPQKILRAMTVIPLDNSMTHGTCMA